MCHIALPRASYSLAACSLRDCRNSEEILFTVKNREDAAWSAVLRRHSQLASLDERLTRAEAPIVDFFQAMSERGPLFAEFGEMSDESFRANDEFALLGEAALMFSESALNLVADAVAEKVDPDREQSWGFFKLRQYVATQGDSLARTLSGAIPSMRVAWARAKLPRDVMVVHPPATQTPTARGWGPGERLRLMAIPLWPDDDSKEMAQLRDQLRGDIDIPDGLSGELVARYALERVPEKLSAASEQALKFYVRKFGCSSIPGDAIAVTRALISELGVALGYPASENA
jgi:hypothetical protein